MITIAGTPLDKAEIASLFPPVGTEAGIIRTLTDSSAAYNYDSLGYLKFEIDLRMSIIDSAVKLARSRFAFKTFKEAYCNEEFWTLTEEGGFRLKEGASPIAAINDIFDRSRLYGTECATAMVIVFYKALADIYKTELFNRLFSRIYLMDWQHLDPSLGVEYYREPKNTLPGDCRYFKNPDVNPETPEWQGENTIDLDRGLYYGHGIGIATAEIIVRALNTHRVKDSTTSAYLMNSATRPDFKSLAGYYLKATGGT